MNLVYQYLAIFFIFSPSPNHLHPLQVENCDSNSRLVVDEDDYGKVRLERVKNVYIHTGHIDGQMVTKTVFIIRSSLNSDLQSQKILSACL